MNIDHLLIGLAGILIGMGLSELTDPYFRRWGWILTYFTLAGMNLFLVYK